MSRARFRFKLCRLPSQLESISIIPQAIYTMTRDLARDKMSQGTLMEIPILRVCTFLDLSQWVNVSLGIWTWVKRVWNIPPHYLSYFLSTENCGHSHNCSCPILRMTRRCVFIHLWVYARSEMHASHVSPLNLNAPMET